MSDQVVQKNPTDKKTPKSSPTKRKAPTSRQVVCQICHKAFPTLTAAHLQAHGFTLTRYRRAYEASTRAPGLTPDGTVTSGVDRETISTIANRIVSDPQVIRDLAGEVQEAIFSSSLRDQLRLSLVHLITERLRLHGDAAAAMQQINQELAQPWRTQQGGPNGSPTPTKDLVQMGTLLNQELKQGEELLLKTVKLAVEEWRSNKGAGTLDGGLNPDRFTGNAEVLPVPASLTAQDRETIRTLWGMFDQAIDADRTLTTHAVPQPPTDADSCNDDPLDLVDATLDLFATEPAPVEEHSADEPVAPNAPTPLIDEDEPF